MIRKFCAVAALAIGIAVSPAAQAGDPSGNFQIKAGYSGVFWDNQNNGIKLNGTTLVGADAGVRDLSLPTATLTYYLTKNIGLELFCCFASAKVIGEGTLANNQLATTWAFPPALTLQYHFDGMGPIVPYLGVGVQWIHYFNEKSKLPAVGLPLDKVSFDDSIGVVLQAGFDYNIGGGLSFGLDVKKTWTDTNITWTNAAGTRITTNHDLDPLIVTANIGYRFNLFGSRSAAPLK